MRKRPDAPNILIFLVDPMQRDVIRTGRPCHMPSVERLKEMITMKLVTTLTASLLFLPSVGVAEEPAAAPPRKILYEFGFGTNKDLSAEQASRRGVWSSSSQDISVTLEAPTGVDTGARLALTVRGRKGLEKVFCDRALWGLIIEPEGYDGGVSMKIYNGGFEKIELLHNFARPGDMMNVAVIDAPKGQWADVDLPLDKFLFKGQRPRRGAKFERFIFMARNPDSEKAFFQVDDFKLYQVKQTTPSRAKPKPPLPAGVLYLQDFNDPYDFDLERYYPRTSIASTTWIYGGLDAQDKPVPPRAGPQTAAIKEGPGCLRVNCDQNDSIFGVMLPLPSPVPGNGTIVEFDCLLKGAHNPFLVGRTTDGEAVFQTDFTAGEAGQWAHLRIPVESLVAPAKPADSAEQKPAKDQSFGSFAFMLRSQHGAENDMLLDNIVVEKP